MRIAVAAEPEGETRVALVPALVHGLLAGGHEVLVVPGAGDRAGFSDTAYLETGAGVSSEALAVADVVLAVQGLSAGSIAGLRSGAATISFARGDRDAWASALSAAGVTAYAMEQVPRISRAQPMDALTSQALVAGYRAVVVAAEMLPRFFPLSVTAAGTVPAAEVLVLGAGVAGLQAIATARRLGAHVSGYDVRASSAEEIASLGATAIDLGLPALEGPAGYAREMTLERAIEQHRLLSPYVAAADVVITTASVPGAKAPMLVTTAMVEAMRPGSVVVDIAVESGGNVEGAVPGATVQIGGAQVWGGVGVPGQLPGIASELYAQNVVNLLALVLAGDVEDEILVNARAR